MSVTLIELRATAAELAEDFVLGSDPTDETIILAVYDFHPGCRDLSAWEVREVVTAYDRAYDPCAPVLSMDDVVARRCFNGRKVA